MAVFFYPGGVEGIDFASLHSPWLIRYAHRHTNVCLSPADRTLNYGFKSRDPQHKNKTPAWAFDFCGGVEGIRTLDTVAGIPHFQCGALDQLCDDSGFFDGFNYSSSPASGVSSSSLSATIGSSINAFSNSASISRNSGSVDSTSNDCSAESVIGVSL